MSKPPAPKLKAFSDLEARVVSMSTARWIRPEATRPDTNGGSSRGYPASASVCSQTSNYKLLAVVGEGTYGVVMKCLDRTTGKIVAIKKFKNMKDRFSVNLSHKEIRITSLMAHDNVIQALRAFRNNQNQLYLVMEYAERNLYDVLLENPNGVQRDELKIILWQLFSAVQYMHSKGVMHRDLKPDNVLLHDDQVKVCDFGFATEIGAEGPKSHSPYVSARWYRAPEVLVGDFYNNSIDIWSLGCLVAELASGKTLFAGKTSIDQLHIIFGTLGGLSSRQESIIVNNPLVFAKETTTSGATRKSLKERLPNMSPALMHLLVGCLHPDPHQRLSASEAIGLPYFFDIAIVKARVAAAKAMTALPAHHADRISPVLPSVFNDHSIEVGPLTNQYDGKTRNRGVKAVSMSQCTLPVNLRLAFAQHARSELPPAPKTALGPVSARHSVVPRSSCGRALVTLPGSLEKLDTCLNSDMTSDNGGLTQCFSMPQLSLNTMRLGLAHDPHHGHGAPLLLPMDIDVACEQIRSFDTQLLSEHTTHPTTARVINGGCPAKSKAPHFAFLTRQLKSSAPCNSSNAVMPAISKKASVFSVLAFSPSSPSLPKPGQALGNPLYASPQSPKPGPAQLSALSPRNSLASLSPRSSCRLGLQQLSKRESDGSSRLSGLSPSSSWQALPMLGEDSDMDTPKVGDSDGEKLKDPAFCILAGKAQLQIPEWPHPSLSQLPLDMSPEASQSPVAPSLSPPSHSMASRMLADNTMPTRLSMGSSADLISAGSQSLVVVATPNKVSFWREHHSLRVSPTQARQMLPRPPPIMDTTAEAMLPTSVSLLQVASCDHWPTPRMNALSCSIVAVDADVLETLEVPQGKWFRRYLSSVMKIMQGK